MAPRIRFPAGFINGRAEEALLALPCSQGSERKQGLDGKWTEAEKIES